jgi:hypothetical protein
MCFADVHWADMQSGAAKDALHHGADKFPNEATTVMNVQFCFAVCYLSLCR